MEQSAVTYVKSMDFDTPRLSFSGKDDTHAFIKKH